MYSVMKSRGRSRKLLQHRERAGTPLLVVDVGVLGAHSVDVRLIGAGLGAEDRQVGVEQHRRVVGRSSPWPLDRAGSQVAGRGIDHRRDRVAALRRPADLGEVCGGQRRR